MDTDGKVDCTQFNLLHACGIEYRMSVSLNALTIQVQCLMLDGPRLPLTYFTLLFHSTKPKSNLLVVPHFIHVLLYYTLTEWEYMHLYIWLDLSEVRESPQGPIKWPFLDGVPDVQ